jgi:hypothetical protein
MRSNPMLKARRNLKQSTDHNRSSHTGLQSSQKMFALPFNHRNNTSSATLEELTDEEPITMNAAIQCPLCPRKKKT